MKWPTSLKGVAAAVSKAGGGMDRRKLMGLAAAAAITTPALCDPAFADTMAADGSLPGDSKEFVALWPGTPPNGPPGSPLPVTARVGTPTSGPPGSPLPLMTRDYPLPDGYHARDVHIIQTPGLIVYRAARPNGLSLLIMPGGGYANEGVGHWRA
jgi:hypothetical protein